MSKHGVLLHDNNDNEAYIIVNKERQGNSNYYTTDVLRNNGIEQEIIDDINPLVIRNRTIINIDKEEI